MAHDEDRPRDVDEQTADDGPPPTVLPANPPRPISGRGRNRPPKGRHRMDASAGLDPDEMKPWEAPPTTEPVDAPPPAAIFPVDEAPSLEPGGWFRRRSIDPLDDLSDELSTPPPYVESPPPLVEPAPDVIEEEQDPIIAEAMSMFPAPPLADASEEPSLRDTPPRQVAVKGGRALIALSFVAAVLAVAAAAWWRPKQGIDLGISTSDSTQIRAFVLAATSGLLGLGVIAATRWRGVRAIVAALIAVVTIAVYAIPAIQDGQPALAVALAASIAITVAGGYLIHGVSRRSASAVVGTIAGLCVVAALGYGSIILLDLPGVSGDADAAQLATAVTIVVSAGLLLDLTTRQVDVGQSGLIASSLLTYVLVFVGATIATLTLITDREADLLTRFSGAPLAAELARVITVGLAGLIAVPITNLLARRHSDRVAAAKESADSIADRVARLASDNPR